MPALPRRALLQLLALLPQPASAFAIARVPAPSRIVAIGDIHGDLHALVDCLELARLFSRASGRWVGGDAVLVQVGDVLDRGDAEAEVLALLRRLKLDAAQAGGAVLTLLGNHEILNAMGIMAFVSARGSTAFGHDRAAAFRPGSEIARELATWPVLAVVGDTAFCHAGITVDIAAHAGDINAAAARWLRGGDGEDGEDDEGDGTRPPAPLSGGRGAKSVVWMRDLSDPPDVEPDADACAELMAALRIIGASRLVVGHTPQARINGACGGCVYRVDLGMAAAMGGGVPEALEIVGDEVTILTQRGERVAASRRVARA